MFNLTNITTHRRLSLFGYFHVIIIILFYFEFQFVTQKQLGIFLIIIKSSLAQHISLNRVIIFLKINRFYDMV